MIKVNGLKYKYPRGPMLQFPSFGVVAGEACLILGQSGVGKTTLLHLLAGLMKAETGSILIDNQELSKISKTAIDKFRGAQIGIVFQKNHFVQALSVIENLLLTQKLSGVKKDPAFANAILQRLGIGQYKNKLTNELSEGEKQRVSIARALVNKPKLILADEPTSALDDDNCKAVYELLKSQAEEIGAALIIVTHDGRLKELVDQRIILSKVEVNV